MEKLKYSESRILIYLDNAAQINKFARQISNKLNVDYGYLLRILAGLKAKKWIQPIRSQRKIFYELTKEAPLNLAKETIRLRANRSK